MQYIVGAQDILQQSLITTVNSLVTEIWCGDIIWWGPLVKGILGGEVSANFLEFRSHSSK